EALHLVEGDPGQLGVAVAEVGVPEARGAVEQSAAVRGDDGGALAAHDLELAAEDARQVSLRGPQRRPVERCGVLGRTGPDGVGHDPHPFWLELHPPRYGRRW